MKTSSTMRSLRGGNGGTEIGVHRTAKRFEPSAAIYHARNDRAGGGVGGSKLVGVRGRGAVRQDDDPGGCVGKEHRRDIIHLQGIILLLADSGKVRARVHPPVRVTLSSVRLYLASTSPLPRPFLYSAAGKIAARNSRYHCSRAARGRGRERASERERNSA